MTSVHDGGPDGLRFVSVLQSHRNEEDRSRRLRSQRRARFVLDLTAGHRRAADAARDRMLEDKAPMRSATEQRMLAQLADITKWHGVMRTNAASRSATRDANAAKQTDLLQSHVDRMRTEQQHASQRLQADDTVRWEAVVERRRVAAAAERVATCREMVLRAVDTAAHIIDYAAEHRLPAPISRTVPLCLASQWMRARLLPALQPDALMRAHVSLELYGRSPASHAATPFSPAFVRLVRNAVDALHPVPPPVRPKVLRPWPVVLLMGSRHSGKSAIAGAVAARLGMKCINDRALVDEAVAELTADYNAEDLADDFKAALIEFGQQAQAALLAGEPVPPALIAALMALHIRTASDDCSGIIFDGAPPSVECLAALEAELSGLGASASSRPHLLLAPAPLAGSQSLVSAALAVSRPPTAAAESVGPASSKEKRRRRKDDEEPLPPVDIPPPFDMPALSAEERRIVDVHDDPRPLLAVASVVGLRVLPSTLFERVAQVRVDVETGEVYHLESRPPPDDRLEFLRVPDRPDHDCAQLFAAAAAFEDAWGAVSQWCHQHNGQVAVLEGEDVDALADALQAEVEASAQARLQVCTDMADAEAVLEHRQALEQEQLDHNQRREAIKKQLLALYVERQVDPLPPALLEPEWTPPSQAVMGTDVAKVLVGGLEAFTRAYAETVTQVHTTLNDALRAFHVHTDSCRERFETALLLADGRQALLDEHVGKDWGPDRGPGLSETASKEEMHLRVDGLLAELRAIIEGRRADGTALVDSLCARGTMVDALCEGIRGLGATLVQAELDRFLMTRQLLLTYFSSMRAETMPIDLPDLLAVDIIPPLRGATIEAPVEAAGAKGQPKKPAAPVKKGRAAQQEEPERPPEAMLVSVQERAVAAMRLALDRMTIAVTPQAGTKPRKGVAEVTRVDQCSPGALATPVAAQECAAAERRIAAIVASFTELCDTVAFITDSLRDDCAGQLDQHTHAQYAAANAAALYLRRRIEREEPLTHRLLLGLEVFAVDHDAPLAPPAEASTSASAEEAEVSADEGAEDDTPVLSCLTFSRLSRILQLFKTCAPDYRLHLEDFLRIVRQADYTPTSTATAPPSTLFARFDEWGAGVIDWREFVTHLLFWCEPMSSSAPSEGPFGGIRRNDMYIDGPSLLNLFDLRTDLGADPLDQDSFLEVPLFFEESMNDDRLNSYLSVLWETFAVDEAVDPGAFVLFLCADEQPLRGMQKAFAMASPPADEPCALTQEQLDRVFHHTAANPRAVGVWDPYATETQEHIFVAARSREISFQDLCATHAGRTILNNSRAYLRKSFLMYPDAVDIH